MSPVPLDASVESPPAIVTDAPASATPAAPAPPPAAPASAPEPLDKREPPFGEFDFALDERHQPAASVAPRRSGPVTWSLYVDTYYAWQFNQPIDHTIFPTTVAPRHDEISLNLAHVGLDVTGLDGPIGRLYIQYGSIVETIAGPGHDDRRAASSSRTGSSRTSSRRPPAGTSTSCTASTPRSGSSRRTSASRATCPRRTGRTRTRSSPTRRPITSSAFAGRSSRRRA